MKKRSFLTLSLAATLSFSASILPAYSAKAGGANVKPIEIKEVGNDSQLDSKQVEIKEQRDKIEALSNDANKAEEELARIQANIADKEASIQATLEEIQLTEDELARLDVEIQKLSETISTRSEKLDDQARAVQVVGEAGSVINFLLESESLSDLLSRIDAISVLVGSNQESLAQQKADQDALETKQEEVAEREQSQQLAIAQLEADKASMLSHQAEQNTLLASINAEKVDAESDLADALVAYEEEQAAKKAEEERIAREAEAAREEANSETESSEVEASVTTATVAASSSASSVASTADTSQPAQSVNTSVDTQEVGSAAVYDKPATPAPANVGSAVGIAQQYLGVPYVWGGTTPAGFDCSGLTSYVYSQLGYSIPRTAAAQYGATTRVSRANAQPGDLVFFNQTGSIDHVGIYMGGGQFIGAQSKGVAVASLDSGYWVNYVVGYGRVN